MGEKQINPIDSNMTNKKTPITLDNVEYILEDMTQEQQNIVQHIADLDRKLSSTKFNLDQLAVGKDAFIKMLKTSLEATPPVTTVDPVATVPVTPAA